MQIKIDNTFSFEFVSKANHYWKGEGSFIRLEGYHNRALLEETYGDLVDDNEDFKLGDITFLRRDCPSSYDFLRIVKKVKTSLGEYYLPLVRAVFRSRFFELDYAKKAVDDLYFNRGLTYFLEEIFLRTKNLFDLPFEVEEQSFKRIPARTTSETLFFLYCLNTLFKRLSVLEAKPIKTDLVITPVNNCTVVMLRSKFKDVTSLLNFEGKDSVGEIVKRVFNLEDPTQNNGFFLDDDELVQWYAWNN